MSQTDAAALAAECVEICTARKAEDVRLYDVSGSSILADYYLICSGNSIPHIRAIQDRLAKELGDRQVKPLRVDGNPQSQWIVMDYGDILIHIFHPELRSYYNIEELWNRDHAATSPDPVPESA